jgi:hypothetical protein
MTPAGFARYSLAIRLFAAAVFTGVGVLVLLRARAQWFGWYTAHVMFFMNTFAFFTILQVAKLLPAGVIEAASLFWPTIVIYFFLFPNGKFVPRWLALPILVFAAGQSGLQSIGLLAQSGLVSAEELGFLVPVFEFFIPIIFVAALGSQVYRYMRVSSIVERAQTRWFILAIVFLIGVPEVGGLFDLDRFFVTFEWDLLSFTLLPIALAIAILRYRLWDIDVIIRRTLQYSLLTGVLLLVYYGGVVLLQGAFGALTGGSNSPLVTVVTTLGVAALFNPLRRRVQEFIDHRFYRNKVDAEQSLARFGAVARDEVDLDRLLESVFGVVIETLRPVKVSSWVKRPEQKRRDMKL